jgi:hypothetical protein
MNTDNALLPPLAVINERLTHNARERYILGALLKLQVRQQEWAREQSETRSVAGQDQAGRLKPPQPPAGTTDAH